MSELVPGSTVSAAPDETPPRFLLELPPELRLMIYEYLFEPTIFLAGLGDQDHAQNFVSVEISDGAATETCRKITASPFNALIRTCKIINADAEPIFYNTLALRITLAHLNFLMDPPVALPCGPVKSWMPMSRVKSVTVVMNIGWMYSSRMERWAKDLVEALNMSPRLEHVKLSFQWASLEIAPINLITLFQALEALQCKVDIVMLTYKRNTTWNRLVRKRLLELQHTIVSNRPSSS
jgi:hypothetical protein